MNIEPIMTDEQKSQAYQLNLISQINMLNTHNYELQQKLEMSWLKIQEMATEVDRLREALKPFAEIADIYNDGAPKTLVVKEYLRTFRAAKEALNGE